MINIIYYSKNRPMQLEASLRSLQTFFKEYHLANKTVVFDASSADYITGYKEIISQYPEVNFVFQTVFQQNTFNALNTHNWFSMFVMDDLFFKEPFSLYDAPIQSLMHSKDILTASLRLGLNIRYCYALNQFMNQPIFSRRTNELCVWDYSLCEGDWGYPYSLDGNIYQTDHIKGMMDSFGFSNPNELEAMLNTVKIGPRFIASYGKSKLLNNPANRVQDKFPNRHENSASAEDLNKLFLSGKRINLDNIINADNDAVHFPIDFEYQ